MILLLLSITFINPTMQNWDVEKPDIYCGQGAPFKFTGISYAPTFDKISHFGVGWVWGDIADKIWEDQALWKRLTFASLISFGVFAVKEETDYHRGDGANGADIIYGVAGTAFSIIFDWWADK